MGRLGIRIATVAFLVLCCVLAASIVNQISAELLSPVEMATLAPIDVAPPDQRSWADRKVILDRNLFGAQIAGDVTPIEPEEDLEETKLPLNLLGTIASEDVRISSAAIEDLNSRKHEVVRVGDFLESHPDVQVAAIEWRRVILQNGARREELVLDAEGSVQASARPAPRRPTASRTRRRPPTRPRVSQPNLSSRLRELRGQTDDESGRRSPASLFSQARILPKYENGEMVGIQLNAIKPGSFYEKFGFKNGDVITELNGIRIDNPGASAQLLSELTEADEFVFEKIGPNGLEKFTIPADEVSRLLGEE